MEQDSKFQANSSQADNMQANVSQMSNSQENHSQGKVPFIFYLCTRNHESQSWLMGVKVY